MTILTISTAAPDCGGGVYSGGFSATANDLFFGSPTADGYGISWMPFTVPLKKDSKINSVTLKVVASISTSSGNVKCSMGFCGVDNVTNPASFADLQGASGTMTTARYTESTNMASYVAGTEYSYDLTNSFKEVNSRTLWVAGNRMAIVIDGAGSSNDLARWFASYENSTYTEARIEIDYTPELTGLLNPMWFM